MGHSVLVQAAELHDFSLIRFPGILHEHDLACNVMILFFFFFKESVPELKYINEISILNIPRWETLEQRQCKEKRLVLNV